jgi:CheY-like chemotaxis protein
MVVATVSDTGTGMDDSVRERAFEPFFTTKAPGKGTGMGLAAAYGAVARHGGSIEIRSQVGLGTEMTVRLPALAGEVREVQEVVSRGIASGFGGEAMVIDDEDGVRDALVQLLESLEYRVTAFGRARDAVDRFAERPGAFDLVVLDLVLPDMSGRETLTALREIDPEVRVLLVSGYTADDEVFGLVRTGNVDFLEKPFQLADLAESLTRLRG